MYAGIVSKQREFFNTNGTKPIAVRVRALQDLRRILRENEGRLESAIHADYGKGAFETFLSELFLVYEEIDAALKNLEEWAKVKIVSDSALTMPGRSYIQPEPLGVALVIGPWNYPYQLSLAPMVAAISAGCTVVLKPSELTVNSSALVAELLRSAFDPEFVAVVEGGVVETTAILAERFDVIFFTGSVPVGKIVYQAAAKHLTPVILELGGKSPTIIAPDANLEIASKRLVWAKFLNAGQTCIAPDYVYVHQSIYESFLQQLAQDIGKADYAVQNGNYVQIINQKNLSRVASLVDPNKVFLGGRYDEQARELEPTILRDVSWSDAVMQEEIFGPVLPILPYDDLDEVISIIKSHERPLALYLFSEDEPTKQKVLGGVSFGGGCVNDAVIHISNGALPFGGVGASGIGSYHGEAGFRAFSHYKSIVDRDVVPDPEIKYPPYTTEKLEILKGALGLSTPD